MDFTNTPIPSPFGPPIPSEALWLAVPLVVVTLAAMHVSILAVVWRLPFWVTVRYLWLRKKG